MGFENLVAKTKGYDKVRDLLPLQEMGMDLDLGFFLAVTSMMRFVDTEKIRLAGVTVDVDGKLLMLVNTKNLKTLPLKQQMFVMAHECSHIVFEHLLSCKKDESISAWNIATDAVINNILIREYNTKIDEVTDPKTGELKTIQLHKLISDGKVIPEKVGKEPNMMTSEDVYNQLIENSPQKPKQGKGKSDPNGDPNDALGNGDFSELDEIDENNFDTHDRSFDWDKVEAETKHDLGQVFKAAERNEYGASAGNYARGLSSVIKKHFDFSRLLDKIIYKKKIDFSREHRRVKLGGGLMFPRKHGEKMKIYVTVDVSGSCWDVTEDFLGYIMALPEFEEVSFFDVGIIETVVKGDVPPHKRPSCPAGGGTDLNPSMAHFEELEKAVNSEKLNFIVLTDGYIPPLTCGPTKSNVIIMTVGDDVEYERAGRKYRNINIREAVKK